MNPLTDDEFAEVRDYLAAEAGLAFDESRRAALTAVVAERLAVIGAADVKDYLAALRGDGGPAERQRLLDLVTVQETHFFRNPPQMQALRRRVLPELLRRSAGRERPLTIWSAGCSTGEEPYTLAMMLLDLSPVLVSPDRVRVLGTDVSAEALRAAARATYTGRTLDVMPPAVAGRWLEPRPGASYGVADQVRRLVELRLHNLVTDPPPVAPGEADLIVCRNVTIYFDRATTARLIGVFHDALAEGGYLLLGHSETLWQVSDAFSLVPVGDAFVYRRAHDSARHPSPGTARRRTPVKPVTRAPDPVGPPDVRGARRRAETLLWAAVAALAEGRYDVAARTAAEAVAVDPLLAPAYALLGEASATLGADVAAVDALRKAVYLDPAAAPAHFRLAGSLSRLGQHAAAAVSYRAAASALESSAPGAHQAFLGGREPQELADLCRRLGAELDQREPVPVRASSGGER